MQLGDALPAVWKICDDEARPRSSLKNGAREMRFAGRVEVLDAEAQDGQSLHMHTRREGGGGGGIKAVADVVVYKRAEGDWQRKMDGILGFRIYWGDLEEEGTRRARATGDVNSSRAATLNYTWLVYSPANDERSFSDYSSSTELSSIDYGSR